LLSVERPTHDEWKGEKATVRLFVVRYHAASHSLRRSTPSCCTSTDVRCGEEAARACSSAELDVAPTRPLIQVSSEVSWSATSSSCSLRTRTVSTSKSRSSPPVSSACSENGALCTHTTVGSSDESSSW
jgi:hypothetical protein